MYIILTSLYPFFAIPLRFWSVCRIPYSTFLGTEFFTPSIVSSTFYIISFTLLCIYLTPNSLHTLPNSFVPQTTPLPTIPEFFTTHFIYSLPCMYRILYVSNLNFATSHLQTSLPLVTLILYIARQLFSLYD